MSFCRARLNPSSPTLHMMISQSFHCWRAGNSVNFRGGRCADGLLTRFANQHSRFFALMGLRWNGALSKGSNFGSPLRVGRVGRSNPPNGPLFSFFPSQTTTVPLFPDANILDQPATGIKLGVHLSSQDFAEYYNQCVIEQFPGRAAEKSIKSLEYRNQELYTSVYKEVVKTKTNFCSMLYSFTNL